MYFNSVVDPKVLFVPAPVTNFRVQDPDPAHLIDAYLEKKKLKFNQEEEFTSYLPFSISHYSPTLHSTEFTGLKLEIIFFIYLLFHYLLDPEQ